MDITYQDSERARAVAERTRAFVDEVVLPKERSLLAGRDARGDADRQAEAAAFVDDLMDEAREREVFAPQMPAEYGGLGLDFQDLLPTFEQAGRSILAQAAMRVAAPDEGNMHILEAVGTDAQRARWLQPLVDGEIKSGFSMTEPHDGCGSDPKMIRTEARREGDEWVVDGHKWWTTQGSEADFLIVVARTDEESHPYTGTSLFIVPADADGLHVVRDVPHMGETGMSHAEIRYDGVRIPESNLLGEENMGFVHAQQRLGPARLTHCMRFLGMADRALDVAKAYMHERSAFGDRLTDKQALRFELVDAETRLHAARTMVRHAAHEVSTGERARVETAMSKVFAAETVQDVVDTCVQVCGGNGIGKDLPLADFYENVRCFRIIDGADEVHKRSIAKRAFDEDAIVSAEVEHLTRFGE